MKMVVPMLARLQRVRSWLPLAFPRMERRRAHHPTVQPQRQLAWLYSVPELQRVRHRLEHLAVILQMELPLAYYQRDLHLQLLRHRTKMMAVILG